MAKPVVKYKTYKQSSQVGGKIYGVPYLGDPQIASVTMQEVIDYCKLHNYSAAQLESLMSQVISGVADLVARDGRPRNLSDLLKFEPKLKGTFDSLVSGVTNQKLVIRPRLLKEMRVNLPSDTFAWRNENDDTSPRLTSVAYDADTEIPITSIDAIFSLFNGEPAMTAMSLSGTRLAPAGWKEGMSFDVDILKGDNVYHLREKIVNVPGEGDSTCGYWTHGSGDQAADNNIKLSYAGTPAFKCWTGTDEAPEAVSGTLALDPGDKLRITFTRILEADGTLVTTDKVYTFA